MFEYFCHNLCSLQVETICDAYMVTGEPNKTTLDTLKIPPPGTTSRSELVSRTIVWGFMVSADRGGSAHDYLFSGCNTVVQP